MLKFKKAWLTHPSLIFAGIIIGLIIGIYNKSLANMLFPIGQFYLTLMGMCILPIILTAIISSIGRALHTEHIAALMKPLFFLLLVGLIAASLFSVIIGSISLPGSNLSNESENFLSSKVIEYGKTVSGLEAPGSFLDFMAQIVPSNIFNALSRGDTLAVVFFAILIGISLGKISSEGSKKTLEITHALFSALLKLVAWIMYALPIGLCFLFAGYAAKISWTEVVALAKLLGVIYGGIGVLIMLCSLLIWRRSGVSYLKSFAALKTPLLIAFGSCSSFIALPSMITNLEEKLHLEKGTAELILPLGINVFRPGVVLQFVITALFIAELYGQHLTFGQLSMLSFAAILASLAVSGMPAIASASVFALVLEPLGLPGAIGVVLLITILPVIDPIVTVFNVQANCALAMLTRPLMKRLNKNKLAAITK